MIGNKLATRLGVIKTTTIEELLGPGDDEIPDFSGMIAKRGAGGRNGLTFAHQSDREAVRHNLEPFVKTINKVGFEPLLLEIAVIHDPRLVEEKRQTVSEETHTFFVSDVISFLDDKREHFLLNAWDSAIKSLLNIDEQIHEVPVPIVTNRETYQQALYYIEMSSILDAAHATTKDGRSVLEDPRWPESPEDIGSIQSPGGNEQASPLPQATTETDQSVRESIEFRRMYKFTWSDIQNKPEESIRFLCRRLIYHLIRKCAKCDPKDGAVRESCLRIENALSQSHLLVIPFKRPRAAGSIERGQNNAEPGGCVFAIIRRKATELDSPKRITDDEIRDLSMRLTWLLAHSALAEAYSEIAMKHDRDFFVSVATHHIPTELRTLQGNIGKSRDVVGGLKDEAGSSRGAEKALGYIEKALSIARRLDATADMLNKAQKSRDSGLVQCSFSKAKPVGEFIQDLSDSLDQAWQQAMEPFLNPGERRNVTLDKSQVSLESVSLPANAVILSDPDLVPFVLLELLRNALRHGNYSKRTVVHLKLLPVSESDGNFVVFEVSNPVPDKALSIADIRSSRPWRIGLSSLDAYTHAFGVPPVNFQPIADGLLAVQITVGKVQV